MRRRTGRFDGASSRSDFQELKEKLELHRSGGVIGIDIARAKHFAVVLDPVGQTIQAPFSFSCDPAGFEHPLERIAELGTRHLFNQWVFGFEASGGYEKNLASFFVENGHNVVQVRSHATEPRRT